MLSAPTRAWPSLSLAQGSLVLAEIPSPPSLNAEAVLVPQVSASLPLFSCMEKLKIFTYIAKPKHTKKYTHFLGDR